MEIYPRGFVISVFYVARQCVCVHNIEVRACKARSSGGCSSFRVRQHIGRATNQIRFHSAMSGFDNVGLTLPGYSTEFLLISVFSCILPRPTWFELIVVRRRSSKGRSESKSYREGRGEACKFDGAPKSSSK